MKEFSERLAQERKRLGHSQASLSEALGISKQSQFKYENAKTSPTVEYLFAIKNQGFNLPWLLGFSTTSTDINAILAYCEKQSEEAYKEVEINSMDSSGNLEPLNKRLPKFHNSISEKFSCLSEDLSVLNDF